MTKIKIYFGDLSKAKQKEIEKILIDELEDEIDYLITKMKYTRSDATKEAVRSHIASSDAGNIFTI